MTLRNHGKQKSGVDCKGPAHHADLERVDSSPRPIDGTGISVSILDYHGTIPILAIFGLSATDDCFNLDKGIFQQHPAWRWFIRRSLPYEARYFQHGANANCECYVLVNNTSSRCRLKGYFSCPKGAPFDGFSIFLTQQYISNHARQIGEIPHD
jgi:hypothetical protein